MPKKLIDLVAGDGGQNSARGEERSVPSQTTQPPPPSSFTTRSLMRDTPAVLERTNENSSSSNKKNFMGPRPTGPIAMFQLSGLQAAAFAPGLWSQSSKVQA